MFLPVKDRKKGDTVGWEPDSGQFYNVGDFTIQRLGPGLSTYDEDTLIAIFQLSAERRIVGSEREVRERFLPGLPESKSDAGIVPVELRDVHLVGTVSPFRINSFFGRETSGAGLAACQASMTRLARTSLSIRKKGSTLSYNVHFFSHVGSDNERASVLVAIDPIMAMFLQEYVVLDLTLRRKLAPVGKSVYRYLEASKIKTIPVLELMEKIGTTMSLADFTRALLGRKPSKRRAGSEGELKVLKDAGWLKSYEIVGTGRNSPFILNIER